MSAEVRAATSTRIGASANDVWTVLGDIASWSEWYPDLRNVQVLSGEGADSTFSFKSGPVTIDAKVDEWEAPYHFGFKGTSRGADSVYRFTITDREGSSEIAVTQVMTGLAVRTMRPMLQKIADTSLPAWLDALKQRVESARS